MVAALWALDAAIELGKRVHFSEGQLLSLAGMFALVGLTALIARELWPGQRRRWLAACAVALAYPIVFRMGIMFHPEMTLAWVCGLAVWLLLRAQRRGWSWRLGAAAGATLGIAATVRQSCTIVILCVGLAALLGGGRRALPFLAAGAVCLAIVAGPWWAYATDLWGSPLKLALDRSGHMVSGEPFSFFLSFPIGELVTHPYRPDFSNQLLPGVHADLWSDYWGSLRNQWTGQSQLTRVTASTQSVLGFGWDALGLLGLATLGLPALLRLIRRASRDASDFAAGFLALLAIGAFAAFAATIVRYPQAYGKEIKAIYMLFTTPCWALFTVAGWLLVARHSPFATRIALPAFAGLYALSYATSLYTFLR